jgi:long-chain acyl-CoA synthetase
MARSWEEAVALVSAPGAPFELTDVTIDGVAMRAYLRAPQNMRQVFDTARARGDQTFLVYEDERWSFADVMANVDALAAALVNRYGVQKGDRVAIGMRNYPEWVVAFAAILSIGAISVSLNAWWTEDEMAYALDDCGATVLVADTERVDRAESAWRRLKVSVVGVRLKEGVRRDGVDRYEDIVDLGAPMPDVAIDGEDDATILYTSGTTGFPKGAVSTHRAIVQSLMAFGCRAAVEVARSPEAEPSSDPSLAATPALPPVFILAVPLFHVTGCIPVMLSSFAAGMRLVMMYRWDADTALRLIERERVTVFVGVPTQSWDLVESPNFSKYDTSSLSNIAGGGAPAPPALVKRVDEGFSGGRPSIGYGMTETNAFGPGNSGDDYLSHPTSTGRVLPILELEIRDPDGRRLPADESGEIWFKGPTLIRGYWGKPEATAETIVDGWLRSGDLGRIDADGFIYVEDRAKDMVLRAGENVYCAEVEAAIYEHPAVYEAAVYGVPDPRLGEQVAATVSLKDGQTLGVEELQRHVAAKLATFKVPTVVTITSERLPRSAAGKILKRELRDAYVAAHPTDG